MKKIFFLLLLLLLLLFSLTHCSSPLPSPSPAFQALEKVPPFQLLDHQGRAVSLSAFYLKNIPILVFIRNFSQDGAWLKNLLPILKKLYTEDGVVMAIYPEGALEVQEIEDFGVPLYFLEDTQSQVAQRYRIWNDKKNEPYFAIFVLDRALNCHFQQILHSSKHAITAGQVLQIYERVEPIEPIEPEKSSAETKKSSEE
jgi:peroxiredoxin